MHKLGVQKIFWIFPLALLVIWLVYMIILNSGDIETGGQCKYEYSKYPAIVLEIEKENVDSIDITFKYFYEKEIDTIQFSQGGKGSRFLSFEEIKNIQVQDTLTYVFGENTQGACGDSYEFVFEKFKMK